MSHFRTNLQNGDVHKLLHEKDLNQRSFKINYILNEERGEVILRKTIYY